MPPAADASVNRCSGESLSASAFGSARRHVETFPSKIVLQIPLCANPAARVPSDPAAESLLNYPISTL